MRSLIALGLVCGMTAPAWARPDGNNDRPPPPSMMRQEVQMRMPVDGRGDTASMMREARPEPWQRPSQEARPQQAERPTQQRMNLPLKSDVAQKAHPGDARDMQPKPQALDARMQNQKPADDRMGRPEQKPTLPIKIEVSMKQHGGEVAQEAASGGSTAQQKKASAPATAKMTPHDRDMLCRTAGVCLPQSHATDDSEDKTE
ncbi:MAG TPA: hypothetical protein VN947_22135 [Polyangia bacterium]|nr:hypothetical protein [Polyangia bacterium]